MMMMMMMMIMTVMMMMMLILIDYNPFIFYVVIIYIGHNSIDSVGCFALCVGMKHNSTVSRLVIDGNNVGEQGSQIIAQTAASSIVENLIISTVNCDFKAASVSSKFNLLGIVPPYHSLIIIIVPPTNNHYCYYSTIIIVYSYFCISNIILNIIIVIITIIITSLSLSSSTSSLLSSPS